VTAEKEESSTRSRQLWPRASGRSLEPQGLAGKRSDVHLGSHAPPVFRHSWTGARSGDGSGRKRGLAVSHKKQVLLATGRRGAVQRVFVAQQLCKSLNPSEILRTAQE
jgi:hypothetical protein